MKVLVTGVKGQLGYDVARELQKRGHEAVGVDIDEMDITDAAAVERVMTEVQPDAVIHCSAYTAVDRAEEDIEICRRVNVDGTENIAKICKKLDCKMLYLSTDYIFSGDGERHGSRMMRLRHSMPTDRASMTENWHSKSMWKNILLSAFPGYLESMAIISSRPCSASGVKMAR